VKISVLVDNMLAEQIARVKSANEVQIHSVSYSDRRSVKKISYGAELIVNAAEQS